ncbi:hypothetical protein [Azotobacter armeniacus]
MKLLTIRAKVSIASKIRFPGNSVQRCRIHRHSRAACCHAGRLHWIEYLRLAETTYPDSLIGRRKTWRRACELPSIQLAQRRQVAGIDQPEVPSMGSRLRGDMGLVNGSPTFPASNIPR